MKERLYYIYFIFTFFIFIFTYFDTGRVGLQLNVTLIQRFYMQYGPLAISKQGRFKNKSKFTKVLNKHAALKKKVFT